VEKKGLIWSFPNQEPVSGASLFADISGRVESGPLEAGLLGLAFHPAFAVNGTVFLSYTHRAGDRLVSRISEFGTLGGATILDPDSERIVLEVDQPFNNHNGGHLAFGPEGYLYIGFGDGGLGGDPLDHGQNTDSVLGSLLRIDVDAAIPYGIPEDNPFVIGGGRPEIHAWGFRNPWRFSFDRGTGELWVADVGQEDWEEVNKVEAGKNYGWNIKEGSHCFKTDPCDGPDLEDPIAEYDHKEGRSITGGFVYRGTALSFLSGVYVFGDFVSGKIWGLSFAGEGVAERQLLVDSGLSISSFGEGHNGDLYILDFETGGIFRLVSIPEG
jgi:glucose/arabinose dehydrogenase